MAYAWLVGGGFAKCPYNYISLIYPHGLWTTPNLEWMGSISSWHTFAIVRERRGIGGTKRGHLQSGLFIFWQGSRNSCWWKKHFLLNEPLDNHIPSGISQVTTSVLWAKSSPHIHNILVLLTKGYQGYQMMSAINSDVTSTCAGIRDQIIDLYNLQITKTICYIKYGHKYRLSGP